MIWMCANAVTAKYTRAPMRDSQTRSSRYVSRCVCRPIDDSFLSKRVKTLAFATKKHLSASKLRLVITWEDHKSAHGSFFETESQMTLAVCRPDAERDGAPFSRWVHISTTYSNGTPLVALRGTFVKNRQKCTKWSMMPFRPKVYRKLHI
jgi:hypothetical protein